MTRTMTTRDRARLANWVVRYKGTLALKRVCGTASRLLRATPGPSAPSVTVFVTSTNNRYPLELTLRTLAACTSYPNYRIVVGDNESTDGARALLDRIAAELPLSVMPGETQPESGWYDQMYRTVESTYWVGLHEDLIFLGRDWLADLVAHMEADPDLWLVEGQRVPPTPGFVEPVSSEVIDLGEQLSTWLFCARTKLRDRLPNTSFAFYKEERGDGSRTQAWDVGGKLLRDMTDAGFRYEVMPWWFRLKWHHVGNLSWVEKYDTGNVHQNFKRLQKEGIRRAVRRRWPEPAL